MKREVEDWLTELPPLDGGDDDLAVDVADADDIEQAVEHDSLDDTSADNLELDDDDADVDDASAEPADDEWVADVGEPELDLPSDETDDVGESDDNELPVGEIDIDEGHAGAAVEDGGDEGTSEPIELDEKLPELDADDEGDFEDALVADALDALDGAETPSALRWADVAWEEKPARSRPLVWCPDDDPLIDVCSSGTRLVFGVTALGGAWVVDGDRVTNVQASALQAAAGNALERPLFVAMEAGARALWIVDRQGRLLRSNDAGLSWQARGRAEQRPVAVAGRKGAVALLLSDANGARVVSSEDGVSWFAQRLAIQFQSSADQPRPWMALCGNALAIGDGAGVWLARDGRTFARVAAAQGATAGVFAGTRSDAPLVVARPSPDDDGGTHVVRVNEVGDADIVAHLAPRLSSQNEDEELSALYLDWDDDGGLLYVVFASVIVVCAKPGAQARRSSLI